MQFGSENLHQYKATFFDIVSFSVFRNNPSFFADVKECFIARSNIETWH